MSKLKVVSSARMCKLLESLGFLLMRQRGSHCFYKNVDGRTTVVPLHANDLDRSLIRKIISDIDLSPDDYNKKV